MRELTKYIWMMFLIGFTSLCLYLQVPTLWYSFIVILLGFVVLVVEIQADLKARKNK